MPIPAALMKRGKKAAEGSAAEEKSESPAMEKGETPEYGDAPHGKKPCKACAKKSKKKGSCGCGDKAKMDRALSPQEYLDACDLGIQDRSKSYIRARLDAVATAGKGQGVKCGNGYIGRGKKCNNGQGSSPSVATGGGKAAQKPRGLFNTVARNMSLVNTAGNAINVAKGLAEGNYQKVGANIGVGIGNALAARSFHKGETGKGIAHSVGTSTGLGAIGALAGHPGTVGVLKNKMKEAMDNPYRDLGVKRGASQEEVKRAYRKKAQRTHPDAGGNAKDFQRVNNAYNKINSKFK